MNICQNKKTTYIIDCHIELSSAAGKWALEGMYMELAFFAFIFVYFYFFDSLFLSVHVLTPLCKEPIFLDKGSECLKIIALLRVCT